MGKLISMEESVEKQWEKVKEHYEYAYKIKFHVKLSQEKIHYLYKKMQQLNGEIAYYFKTDPVGGLAYEQYQRKKSTKNDTQSY